jgi:hypothetical protein
MAGVDKIYFTKKQYYEYKEWAFNNDIQCHKMTGSSVSVCLLAFDDFEGDIGVCNNTERIDWYLWKFCNLPYVQKRLKEQYGYGKSSTPINDFYNLCAYIIIINDGNINRSCKMINNLYNYKYFDKKSYFYTRCDRKPFSFERWLHKFDKGILINKIRNIGSIVEGYNNI